MAKTVIFMLALFFSSIVQAQVTVKGTVTDVNDEPLIGVNVVLKSDAKVGTVTDPDGNFTLSVPSSKESLVFSFIGMQKKIVTLKGKTVLNVVMDYDNNMMDEVVVSVGYGQTKKSDLTGAVASVSGDKLAASGMGSIEQGLQGRLTGVSFNASDNAPGAGIDIVIRGSGSINASSAPLYVIDGFPVEGDYNKGGNTDIVGSSPLMSLDPGSIESIDVLKDASATAIYGARGANGVIIVTTKSGRDGKLDVNFSANYGVSKMFDPKIDMLDSYGYAKSMYYKHFPFAVRDGAPEPEHKYIQWYDYEQYKDTPTTNWIDEIKQLGQTQNYNVSVSGGNTTKNGQKYNFMGNIGYFNNKGVLKYTEYERYTGNFKFNAQPNKWMQIGINANLSFTENNGTVTVNSGGAAQNAGIIQQARRTLPNKSPDSDFIIDDETGEFVSNPVAILRDVDMVRKEKRIIMNGNISFFPMKGLTVRILGGITKNEGEYKKYAPSTTGWGRMDNGAGTISNHNTTTYLNENTITYSKHFNNRHTLNALAGFTIQTSESFNNGVVTKNFPIESMGFNNMGVGIDYQAPTSYFSDYTLLSYLARLNYSYCDKYLLTASFRADGSSKFAENNKWGYFPSFSAAWRVNQEKFMKNIDWIDNLKIRAGWGMTGNPNIKPYQSFVNYVTDKYPSGSDEHIGIYPNNLPNPNLKWESSMQGNIGIDFAVLRNRLSLTLDTYVKTTKDLLLYTDIAPSIGKSSYLSNLGKIENKGVEIALNSVILDNKFKWTNTVNITVNRNKVKSLSPGITQMDVPGCDEYAKAILRVGEPIGLWYGYETEGLLQQEDFIWDNSKKKYTAKPGVAVLSKTTQPGSWKFKDQNNDGVINEADKKIIGRAQPKFEGGMINNFSYKNFDLSLLLEFSYGRKVYNANNRFAMETSGDYVNKMDVDYWLPIVYALNPDGTENREVILDKGNIHAAYPGYNVANPFGPTHDGYLEDASYLRIKNITFGYNFNSVKLRPLGIRALRLYFSANNLHTFTKYSGFDPNVSGNDLGGLRPGFDLSSYPLAMSFMFGVNVKF